MGESQDNEKVPDPTPRPPDGDGGRIHQQQVHKELVGARVPERIAPGVFATAAMVLQGHNEFVIDFVQGLASPIRIAARVVMAPPVLGQFAVALRGNLQHYEQAFGPPKPMPKPSHPAGDGPRENPQGEAVPAGGKGPGSSDAAPARSAPSIQDVYDQLRLPEELLSGAYASAVMITHSPAEFFFDFITTFFPTAAVSVRVFMSASQVPGLLDTLNTSLQTHVAQRGQGQPPQPPQPPPACGA